MGVHHDLFEDHRGPARWALRWTLALVISALALSPHTLVAQTAPASQQDTDQPAVAQSSPDDDALFGADHRRQMYEESKLSTTRAVLYNLALPGLGNVYAEQYFYGGIAFSLMVFTTVFVSYGLVTDQSDFLWIGGTTAAIAYTGSIATSIYGVRDYNEKLRQGLKVDQDLAASPWAIPPARTVDLTIRFD